jgi:hypothetical protein
MRVQLLLVVGMLGALPMSGEPQTLVTTPRLYVFDVAGDSRVFTSASKGVRFDLDGDGKLERVAWTRPDSDDSFLFLDTNGNRLVDSGRELAGSAWIMPDGRQVPEAFVSLVLMQGLSTGGPGPVPAGAEVINGDDEVYSRLRLWTDRNHNGASEQTELRTLTNAGVLEISLMFRKYPKPLRDAEGNETQLEGRFWMTSDGGLVAERRLGLVRFATR